MKRISQVAKLTGVSVRTLQYYDEIGLLKPTELTPSGYRLYDDDALQTLQQILFLKELDFPLKEIREILENPDFDKTAAFRKQRELFQIKRSRIDRLIHLLDRLEKGESCISFKEFDLSEYLNALENFKCSCTAQVIQHWGSIENFDLFLQKIRDNENHVAELAISQFGSIEAYTEAMKYNLEHFSEIMEAQLSRIPEEMKAEDLFVQLASHREEDISSKLIQNMVQEQIARAHGNASSELVGDKDSYCAIIIDTYSNDYFSRVFDAKQGAGSSAFIVNAFRYYISHTAVSSK